MGYGREVTGGLGSSKVMRNSVSSSKELGFEGAMAQKGEIQFAF